MGTVLKSEYKWQWNINLHRFLVFNSLHFYIILDQLIHISDNCTSLNVHQHKGRYNVAKEKKHLKSRNISFLPNILVPFSLQRSETVSTVWYPAVSSHWCDMAVKTGSLSPIWLWQTPNPTSMLQQHIRLVWSSHGYFDLATSFQDANYGSTKLAWNATKAYQKGVIWFKVSMSLPL